MVSHLIDDQTGILQAHGQNTHTARRRGCHRTRYAHLGLVHMSADHEPESGFFPLFYDTRCQRHRYRPHRVIAAMCAAMASAYFALQSPKCRLMESSDCSRAKTLRGLSPTDRFLPFAVYLCPYQTKWQATQCPSLTCSSAGCSRSHLPAWNLRQREANGSLAVCPMAFGMSPSSMMPLGLCFRVILRLRR